MREHRGVYHINTSTSVPRPETTRARRSGAGSRGGTTWSRGVTSPSAGGAYERFTCEVAHEEAGGTASGGVVSPRVLQHRCAARSFDLSRAICCEALVSASSHAPFLHCTRSTWRELELESEQSRRACVQSRWHFTACTGFGAGGGAEAGEAALVGGVITAQNGSIRRAA